MWNLFKRKPKTQAPHVPDQYEIAALEHVNNIRGHYGIEPVTELSPGRAGSAAHCPIASSIKAGREDVDAYSFKETGAFLLNEDGSVVLGSSLRISTPQAAFDFIIRFDEGKYKHLVIQ